MNSSTVQVIARQSRVAAGQLSLTSESLRNLAILKYDGICHLYIAKDADPTQAVDLAINSKCQSVQVCNALERRCQSSVQLLWII